MSPLFKIGQEYTIRSLPAGLDANHRSKLLSMGLMPGITIKVERIAPFGDPIQLRVNDFALSLRKKELAQLNLEAVQ